MIEMSLATCFLASRVQSLQNSKRLKAISMRSLLSSKCWLLSFVKITMKALMRESRRWISTSSWSSGSIFSMLTVSYCSVSTDLPSSFRSGVCSAGFRMRLALYCLLPVLTFRDDGRSSPLVVLSGLAGPWSWMDECFLSFDSGIEGLFVLFFVFVFNSMPERESPSSEGCCWSGLRSPSTWPS